MSVTDDQSACGDPADADSDACKAYPTFELDWAVDDPANPAVVTVAPEDPEDPTTEWLSIDAAHAVPLGDVR